MELLHEQCKKEILKLIKESNYPKNHPFLDKSFENDQFLDILAYLKSYINQNMIDSYITGKLKAHNKGVFALDKYRQVFCEVTFLWYLVAGLIKNNKIDVVNTLIYEPMLENGKKLEYSFYEKDLNLKINFEVKNINCDPFLKDTNIDFKKDGKYIKSYFGDPIESLVTDSQNYTEISSQYSQIKSALKKINDKFIVKDNELNVGVIVCQFSTSWEEFITYFLHPKKGYINLNKKKKIFDKFDLVVFFSGVATPDINYENIYQTWNTYSYVISNRIPNEILLNFRLDNVVFYNGRILDEMSQFINENFGKYVFIIHEGIIQFFSEDIPKESVDKYCKQISDELYHKK